MLALALLVGADRGLAYASSDRAYADYSSTTSTEVVKELSTVFHYFDYSPAIDVTYQWNEDLEWTYIKYNNTGVWLKGKLETHQNAWTTLGFNPNNIQESIRALKTSYNSFPLFDKILNFGHTITFTNNSTSGPLDVNIEETYESSSSSSSSSASSSSSVQKQYLNLYEGIYRQVGTTHQVSYVVSTTATAHHSLEMKLGEVGSMKGDNYDYIKQVAFLPIQNSTTYVPYWKALNREGSTRNAQIYIVFSKAEPETEG